MEGPQKTKNRTTVWSSNPPSRYTLKGNKLSSSRRYLCSHIHWSIIHSSQDMETPNCPLADEWIKILWYICNGIIFILKKENPDICNNTDKTWGHYAKRNKPDTERKKTAWSHLYAWSKSWIHKKKQSKTEVTSGEEVGEMGRWANSTKLQLCRMNKSRDLMDSMITS